SALFSRAEQLPQHHCDAVDLLSRGTCRAPDANSNLPTAGLAAPIDQVGQYFVAQQLERSAVAKEQRLAGRDGVDDGELQISRLIRPRFVKQLAISSGVGLRDKIAE